MCRSPYTLKLHWFSICVDSLYTSSALHSNGCAVAICFRPEARVAVHCMHGHWEPISAVDCDVLRTQTMKFLVTVSCLHRATGTCNAAAAVY